MNDLAHRFLPDAAPSVLRPVVEYWDARRGSRLMPSFDDIDPLDIPWALSRLYILRVIDGGDFVYRLAGTEIERPYGHPLKGTRISDLYPADSARVIQARWNRVAAEPACCYTDTEHPSPHGTFVSAQRVTMPLSADGRTVDHILGVAMFGRMRLDDQPLVGGAVIRDVIWASLATGQVTAETRA